MTVYLDEVFVLNFLLDFLLFKTANLLSDSPKRSWRTVVAALLGGSYAAAASAFTVLSEVYFKLLVAFIMCVTAYGVGKAALRQSMFFLLVCCGFGGMVLTICALCKNRVQLFYGMPYFLISSRFLLLLAGILYTGTWLTMRQLCRHFGELVTVKFCINGRKSEVTALCDTGNTLKDPISAEPVIIADLTTAKNLLPQIGITRTTLQQPTNLLQMVQLIYPETKPRLLPFRTVGNDGMLLAVRCDSIYVNGKKTGNHILAFSPTAFTEGEAYQALTGGIYEPEKTKNNSFVFGILPKRIRTLYRRK